MARPLTEKRVAGVASMCKALDIPCVALVGSIGEGADRCLDLGITSYFSICSRPLSLDEAMRDAESLLIDVTARIMRLRGIRDVL